MGCNGSYFRLMRAPLRAVTASLDVWAGKDALPLLLQRLRGGDAADQVFLFAPALSADRECVEHA